MRSSDSIQFLLHLRSHREELEERRLSAIIEKLKLMQSELADVSTELSRITSMRVTEIQSIVPNTHYQEIEAYSNSLWKRSGDQTAEIERLKQDYTQQMSEYLSARRDREIMETLDRQRTNAIDADRNSREQKGNEELFLARMVANWDRLS